jgi:hypothetical protein
MIGREPSQEQHFPDAVTRFLLASLHPSCSLVHLTDLRRQLALALLGNSVVGRAREYVDGDSWPSGLMGRHIDIYMYPRVARQRQDLCQCSIVFDSHGASSVISFVCEQSGISG